MERLFEEWFVTLDELKGVCDVVKVRQIRALTDRSDYLLDAIGGLQPPRPKLCEQRGISRRAEHSPGQPRVTRALPRLARALGGRPAAAVVSANAAAKAAATVAGVRHRSG
jgi:hypothetical protein